MKIEKILIIVLVVLALAGFAWSAANFFGFSKSEPAFENTPENFRRAVEDELPDKCQTPTGYTDEDWQIHMSHHPERYKECF